MEVSLGIDRNRLDDFVGPRHLVSQFQGAVVAVRLSGVSGISGSIYVNKIKIMENSDARMQPRRASTCAR
jgi:hypothetical protein